MPFTSFFQRLSSFPRQTSCRNKYAQEVLDKLHAPDQVPHARESFSRPRMNKPSASWSMVVRANNSPTAATLSTTQKTTLKISFQNYGFFKGLSGVPFFGAYPMTGASFWKGLDFSEWSALISGRGAKVYVATGQPGGELSPEEDMWHSAPLGTMGYRGEP